MVLGALAVAAGSSLQGLTGFGANLVAVPLLLLIDPGLRARADRGGGDGLNLLSSIRADSGDILPDVRWTIAGQLPGAGGGGDRPGLDAPAGADPAVRRIVLVAAGGQRLGLAARRSTIRPCSRQAPPPDSSAPSPASAARRWRCFGRTRRGRCSGRPWPGTSSPEPSSRLFLWSSPVVSA